MSKYRSDSLFGELDSRLRGNDNGGPCSHIIRVAFESAADTEFDYFVPDKLWPVNIGQRIEAPFGRKNKPEVGFWGEADISHRGHREAPQKRGKIFKLKRIPIE